MRTSRPLHLPEFTAILRACRQQFIQDKQKTRFTRTEASADGAVFQGLLRVGEIHGPDVAVDPVANETVDRHGRTLPDSAAA